MNLRMHLYKSKYSYVRVFALAVLAWLVCWGLFDVWKYPPSARVTIEESEVVASPVALKTALSVLRDSEPVVHSLENVRGDCRYCYTHSYLASGGVRAGTSSPLRIDVVTQTGAIFNVSVSQTEPAVRKGWSASSDVISGMPAATTSTTTDVQSYGGEPATQEE